MYWIHGSVQHYGHFQQWAGLMKNAEDFKRYFPTDALVTGYDIIFFWVSRMIFQGIEFTGKRPFKDVLIHGLVRDAEGRKMSKSLAMVLTQWMSSINTVQMPYVISYQQEAHQVRIYVSAWKKVESTWNFANKIWNASRFALMNMDGMKYEEIDLSGEKSVADKWILTRLNETIETVTRFI